MRGRRRRNAAIAAALTLLLGGALAGCGLVVPADPDGTLDRVRGGELRVGLSPEPGLVEIDDDEASGALVDIAEDFARSIDADPRWTVRGEESLVAMLEDGRLDVAIGGFTERTPWADRVGVSRPYPGVPGSDGRPLVVLVPLGENAFLSELERFLDREVGS